DTPSAEIYTLSLHDALPIYGTGEWLGRMECTHCGGTGQWDSDHLARYEKGQAHRRDRIERRETILEAAARLGVTPAQLSSFETEDRKSTRLNSSHVKISYAV